MNLHLTLSVESLLEPEKAAALVRRFLEGLNGPDLAAVASPMPAVFENSHSPDFASVRWNGHLYALAAKQRRVVKVLWDAFEQGSPCVSGDYLLEVAGAASPRVADLFKRSPAWESLIVRGSAFGGPPGSYCLAPKREHTDA